MPPRYRSLNIFVDITCECLAAVPDTSILGKPVARKFSTHIRRRDRLGMVVSDHGIEITSNVMLGRIRESKFQWDYIAPVKSIQNGFYESFIWRMHDRLLNEMLCFGIGHAREKIRSWVSDLNNRNPYPL